MHRVLEIHPQSEDLRQLRSGPAAEGRDHPRPPFLLPHCSYFLDSECLGEVKTGVVKPKQEWGAVGEVSPSQGEDSSIPGAYLGLILHQDLSWCRKAVTADLRA